MATWTVQPTGLAGNILTNGLAASPSILVVVTDAGELSTSPDGATWTPQASPFGALSSPVLSGIAWNGTIFCVLGFDQVTNFLWASTSPDGVTWSSAVQVLSSTWSSPLGTPQMLAWGNGLFYIGSQYLGGASDSATSPDGVTWTDVTGVPVPPYSLIFDGTEFVQGIGYSGQYIASAPDGATWTLYGSTGFTARVIALGYNLTGAGPLAALYVASDANNTTRTSTTVDFSSATTVITGLEAGFIFGFAFDQQPAGTLIGVGETFTPNARATVTQDGSTWTLEDIGFDTISATPNGIIYGLGQFIAYGTLGALSTRSSGPAPAYIPDVTNTSLTAAESVIVADGFAIGTVGFAPSAIVIAGNVISQDPVGGTEAALGTAVNLVVSTGLPQLTVPDLFGMTQTDSVTLLESLGLVVGAIGSAPSQTAAPGTVQTQNPSPGTPVAAGSVVSFVISTGVPAAGVVFDFEATIISQYANSPTILQLASNMNEYVDQSANFANFFNYVWNVDTAQGFGLDIWGVIVGVSRLLQIPNTTDYVGFYQPSESQPAQDWQPMGSDQPPQPAVGGQMYTGYNATDSYLLPDNAYRQLILAKAFANIAATTAPALNQILQNLYGPGAAFVLNDGPMAISYNLTFTPTAIQLAILEQSGVIPTPPGVAVTINTGV